MKLRNVHGVAHVDVAIDKNLGAKAAAMRQRFDDPGLCHLLKISARLTKPEASQDDPTDPELSAYQVIESHVPRHHVAAALRFMEPQLLVALDGLDRLGLNEGDLRIGGCGSLEMVIALEPMSRDSPSRFH